ncbi:hypothetical protein DFH08DRAFT_240518 [Mycena albidolilacea]|uniref:Uncharacterized protein n=1 Tax=Mycena albidolilacea TaxID=1033008 RepID=A0AAD7ENV7_9AGAR|nr:hypothetical protein DFH08DRAFT_240518 [Mycena albidolilacea]
MNLLSLRCIINAMAGSIPNTMAGNSNTLIVLGSSPDSYFIGHGRRHFVENMPTSFTNHAKTDLNISMVLWISMSKNLDTWISYNTATTNFHFNRVNQDIADHLSGANGKAAAAFVSFPDSTDPAYYFVTGKDHATWNAFLDDYLIQKLSEAKTLVGATFDAALTGMLFGKGRTHIFTFQTGFLADLDDDEVPSEEHPLHKVLVQYNGWCIERGSTLCFYDSRYFFLKFKRPGDSQIQMNWNLPPNMDAKLRALQNAAQQPEEQMALMQESQGWTNTTHTVQNAENQLNINRIRRAELNQALLGGETIVEYRRYY